MLRHRAAPATGTFKSPSQVCSWIPQASKKCTPEWVVHFEIKNVCKVFYGASGKSRVFFFVLIDIPNHTSKAKKDME